MTPPLKNPGYAHVGGIFSVCCTALSNSIKPFMRDLTTLREVLPDSDFAVFSLQEPYTNPLASISCWHVHCEECWLRTLVSFYRNICTPSLHLSRAHPLNAPPQDTSRDPHAIPSQIQGINPFYLLS